MLKVVFGYGLIVFKYLWDVFYNFKMGMIIFLMNVWDFRYFVFIIFILVFFRYVFFRF